MGDTDETLAALARLMLIKSLATSGFPELAFVLVRFDQVASGIVNGNHKIPLFTPSSPSSPCSEKL
jgi:hypothetical protein